MKTRLSLKRTQHTATSERRRPEFVDRDQELNELHALASRGRPALALLYGRRRVGKTFLLGHAWDARARFYFLAADSTPEANRRDLLREFASWLGRDLVAEDFPTWRAVFRLFVSVAEERPLIVVLDEFQYLLEGGDDVVSQLVAIWDHELRGRPLMLVLCGSEVGTMEALRGGGSPLYGRLAWAARLRPFDYWDARRMVPGRPIREAAYIYGIYGGTPRFLAAIEPAVPLDEEVVRTMLSPRGEVHLQLENLIVQERGIREPADYLAVLQAVAAGHTETDRIAAATGLGGRAHVVRRALQTLEDLGLIRRERNFRSGRRAPWKNRVADHVVRFWYRFVHANRSRLETGQARRVWQRSVAPQLDAYMGRVFEDICREAFLRHHERWGLAGAAEWTRWEGQDRNRRSIEIDIAAELDTGELLTGEVKWSSRPVDWNVHLELVRDLEDLANSGQAWGRDALDPSRSAGHIYFSAAGFSEYFRRKAREAGRIRLLDLAEIYRGR